MRTLVVVLVLAPLAAAPLVAADTCLPTCDVNAIAMRLFVPAVTVVQSGSAVSWASADNNPHTATDEVDLCFHASFGSTRGASVAFAIEEGILYAGADAGALEACSTPPMPDGSFHLQYVCLLHRQMTGDIIVVQ